MTRALASALALAFGIGAGVPHDPAQDRAWAGTFATRHMEMIRAHYQCP